MSFQLRKKFAGRQPKEVQAQKRANPKLQRTQLRGNEDGITKKTSAATGIIQSGVVRLPNRAVPLNSDQPKKRRAGRQRK